MYSIVKTNKDVVIENKETKKKICGHLFPKLHMKINCRFEVEEAMTVGISYEWMYDLAYNFDNKYKYNFNFGIPKEHLQQMIHAKEDERLYIIKESILRQGSSFRNALFSALVVYTKDINNFGMLQTMIGNCHNLFRTDYQQTARVVLIDQIKHDTNQYKWDNRMKLIRMKDNSNSDVIVPYFLEWIKYDELTTSENTPDVYTHLSDERGLYGLFIDIEKNSPLIWLYASLKFQYGYAQKSTGHNNDVLIIVRQTDAIFVVFEPSLTKEGLPENDSQITVKKLMNRLYELVKHIFLVFKNKHLYLKHVTIDSQCEGDIGLQSSKDLEPGLCSLYSPYFATIYALNMDKSVDVPCVFSMIENYAYMTMAMFMFWLFEILKKSDTKFLSEATVVIKEYAEEKPYKNILLLL